MQEILRVLVCTRLRAEDKDRSKESQSAQQAACNILNLKFVFFFKNTYQDLKFQHDFSKKARDFKSFSMNSSESSRQG